MADIDTRLANRILLGLVLGAVAGVIVLVVGQFAPALLQVGMAGLLTGCFCLLVAQAEPR